MCRHSCPDSLRGKNQTPTAADDKFCDIVMLAP